jgi:bifunctional UDP-N-acetylglucosamine pyrophosphorylase/glucosamine-1-phosphate N-acetyltransferase
MSRVLIIPAAGHGTRLGSSLPKVLVPVAGVAMLDRLLALYAPVVDRVVLVVNPASAPLVEAHLGDRVPPKPVSCVEQASPTGMLDAILLAMPLVTTARPDSIWITWCDQVAVHRKTIESLASRTTGSPADLVMPTVSSADPYIHLERDAAGRIVRVLHRREGDTMPAVGESDMGLFALSARAYCDWLPQYAGDVEIGRTTGERNFLPFIPWVNARAAVETFPSHDPIEAVGINTPEERRRIEQYLAR